MTLLNLNTNDILVEEKKDKITYFLPCYVRIKVKSVKQLEIESLSGMISGTLLFSFYYGNLPRYLIDQFTGPDATKSILLQLGRQESIELKEDKGITFKEDPANKFIDYVVRTQFDCHLTGDVVYTPFEILNLTLSVTVQSVILNPKLNNGKKILVKFNCMSSNFVTTIDSFDCTFGTYNLADYFLDSDYTNKALDRFSPISVMDPELKIMPEKAYAVKNKKKLDEE